MRGVARLAALTLAALMPIAAGPPAAAQTPPADACTLSPEETALVMEANRRRSSRGAPLDVSAQHTSPPTEGCGIWEVQVAPDGAVTSASLSRGEFEGGYEALVRPWLLAQRYRPADEPWTALVVVRFIIAG